MKRWLPAMIIIFLFAPSAWADVAAEHYNRGNRLYEQKDFAGALAAYDAAYDAGADDADLFLNLGNAAFRRNELGLAVWAYEMGLRRGPRHDDLRFNLRYAEAFLRDDLPEVEEAFLVRLAGAVAMTFTAGEALVVAAVAWFALGLVALLWLPRRKWRGRLVLTMVVAGMILLVFAPLAGWRAYDQFAMERAVVTADELVVRTAPTAEASEAFTVHAGLRLEILDQRSRFARVRVASGLQGWVPVNSYRTISP